MNPTPESTLPAGEPSEKPKTNTASSTTPAPQWHPRLMTYDLSLDRVLGLPQLQVDQLTVHVPAALQGRDVAMSSVIISNDGGTTMSRLLRAHGAWPSQPTNQSQKMRS